MTWLDLLACPQCTGALKLEGATVSTQPPETADLICPTCKTTYPVRNGIPRLFVTAPLERNQAQVQNVFEFKWKQQTQWGIKGGSASFLENWIFGKYGWKDKADYQNYMKTRRLMLDAGCGLGREAIRMAEANPQAQVVALELSVAVDEAQQHAKAKGLKNLLFVQSDLLSPPVKRHQFDFIFSEGVLHHTSSTQKAVQQMISLLAPKGEFAFYVYRKKAPLREYADDYVREQLQNQSLEKSWAEMEALTHLAKALSDLKQSFTIPEDVPVLGFRKGKHDLQRWIYNTCFKCFWNDEMPFKDNVMINFDWYLPRYAWRHTEEEVRGWLEAAQLQVSREFVEDAGITMRAVKN